MYLKTGKVATILLEQFQMRGVTSTGSSLLSTRLYMVKHSVEPISFIFTLLCYNSLQPQHITGCVHIKDSGYVYRDIIKSNALPIANLLQPSIILWEVSSKKTNGSIASAIDPLLWFVLS
jgi:hypothetical protein